MATMSENESSTFDEKQIVTAMQEFFQGKLKNPDAPVSAEFIQMMKNIFGSNSHVRIENTDPSGFPRLYTDLKDDMYLCTYIDKEIRQFKETDVLSPQFGHLINGMLVSHPEGHRYKQLDGYSVNDMNESIIGYENGMYKFEFLIQEKQSHLGRTEEEPACGNSTL